MNSISLLRDYDSGEAGLVVLILFFTIGYFGMIITTYKVTKSDPTDPFV